MSTGQSERDRTCGVDLERTRDTKFHLVFHNTNVEGEGSVNIDSEGWGGGEVGWLRAGRERGEHGHDAGADQIMSANCCTDSNPARCKKKQTLFCLLLQVQQTP